MQHAWQHPGILGDSKGQDQQVQVVLKGQIILVTDIYHRGGGDGFIRLCRKVSVLERVGRVQILPDLGDSELVPHHLLVPRLEASLHQYPPQGLPLQPQVIIIMVVVPLPVSGDVVQHLANP